MKCFASSSRPSPTPTFLGNRATKNQLINQASAPAQRWLKENDFRFSPHTFCLTPDAKGNIAAVFSGAEETLNIWSIAHLSAQLPPRSYALSGTYSAHEASLLSLGWALGAYRFDRFRKSNESLPTLVIPKNANKNRVTSAAQAIYWARDLINRPANDLGPEALEAEAAKFAQTHKAKSRTILGKELLKQNYPAIYHVGQACTQAPRLVDIHFARPRAPKIVLVGKGVTFDSGGLDIKPTSGMKLMKKDMGGAACVLALAKMIIDAKLPVDLRVLLPIVENSIAGNAMRPMDIINTRKGITVEIGNTDAEGRLILCDALCEASHTKPDLIIDMATLTGAARVALGADVPAFFTPDDDLAARLSKASAREHDPLWRLPLYTHYRKQLDTAHADLSNDPETAYGGAIHGALFLQEFVDETVPWIHIDLMAWNLTARAGRPKGGEAMAVRACFSMIEEKYGHPTKR